MSIARSMRRREVRRRYAQPCRGYWSAWTKEHVPPEVITGASTADSYNTLIDAEEQHLIPRRGIAYYNETDVTAQVGLLEAVTKNLSMNMLARHLIDVQYPSATPGSIVGVTALYTDRDDTGHFGQLYVPTSTQGTRKVLGHEMGTLASPGTTHYPRSVARSRPNFRMIPIPYMAGGSGTQATGYNRCTFPLMRALLAGGAMKLIQAGGKVYCPALHGGPWEWDGRSNPSTSTGSEQVHIGPWGIPTPMFPLSGTKGTAATSANDQVWWDGDQFFLSVVFQMEDGSFSAPQQCRIPNATLTSGFGLITVSGPTTSGSSAYRYLQYLLPIGPPGTRARLVCRSRKTNISTAGTRPAGMTPQGATSDLGGAGLKLYVTAVVRDNATITFRDFQPNDDVLTTAGDDPVAINPFYTWPLPARYCFEMERRIAVGYTRKQSPYAILLSPNTASNNPFISEDGTDPAGFATTPGAGPYGDYARCWRLYKDTSGGLTLQIRDATIGTATITSEISTSIGGGTIQEVIDLINATTSGTITGWCAMPAPGADPLNAANNLAPSVVDVASCTLAASSTITAAAGAFADVAIGHRVKVQSGTGTVPANTVVIGKASDASITIGDENGNAANATAGTATLRFWSDTGDDSWSTDTATWDVGNIRSYSGSFYAAICFRGSYLDGLGLDKQGIMYTGGSPGSAGMAPRNFINSDANRARGPSDAGVFMGGASVYPNAIAFFSDGIYSFKAVKDTNTGEDRDFRLFPLGPKGLGCQQYGTIVSGRGWAGCLTRDGYWVSDNTGASGQAIISPPLFNPGHARQTGILAYQCLSLASFVGVADLPRYQTAHAYVVDGTLRLSFIPNAALA